MFYTYNQNNSGGRFIFKPKRGISHYVIIEANSGEEADERAEDIGLYFDGCSNGNDCRCCGDRWDRNYEKGTDVPKVYGEEVFESNGDIADVYIHYLDGRVAQSLYLTGSFHEDFTLNRV